MSRAHYFDVIATRQRLGLTQKRFGELVRLGQPRRDVAAWELHQRTAGARGHAPGTQSIALLILVEALWRIYHHPGRIKAALGALLPPELCERKP